MHTYARLLFCKPFTWRIVYAHFKDHFVSMQCPLCPSPWLSYFPKSVLLKAWIIKQWRLMIKDDRWQQALIAEWDPEIWSLLIHSELCIQTENIPHPCLLFDCQSQIRKTLSWVSWDGRLHNVFHFKRHFPQYWKDKMYNLLALFFQICVKFVPKRR